MASGASTETHSAELATIVASITTTTTDPPAIHHFEKLPVELVLKVMKNCPDFTTLWGLIHTKPLHIGVFYMEPVNIVEGIMRHLYDAEHPLNILMRHVIDIRSGNYAFSTWGALREITETAAIPLPFSLSLPPLLMRQFVQLAHKIHILAHMLIQQGLWRFEDDFKVATCWHPNHISEDCGTRADGFHVPEASLLAEERALVAFWRLQFFLELKAAANDNNLPFWSGGDKSRMRYMRVMEFYTDNWVRRQVATAADMIDSMERQPWETHIVGSWPFALPSMAEIARKLAAAGGSVNMSELVCYPRRTNFNVRAVTMEPTAYQFLVKFCRAPARWASRLRYLPTHRFRKYGVFFWDNVMLTESGLLPENILELQHNRQLKYECFLKWLRLLEVDPEDVELALTYYLNSA